MSRAATSEHKPQSKGKSKTDQTTVKTIITHRTRVGGNRGKSGRISDTRIVSIRQHRKTTAGGCKKKEREIMRK